MRLAACILSLCVLGGCDDSGGLIFVSNPKHDPVEIEPLKVGPVSFFNDACARCHGEFGWGYEDGFTEKYTRDELKKVVHEMVVGPSQRTLGDRELEALTDLHYAIDAGDEGLFLAVTEIGESLRGEGLPGTHHVIRSDLNEKYHGLIAKIPGDGKWSIDNRQSESFDAIWVLREYLDEENERRLISFRLDGPYVYSSNPISAALIVNGIKDGEPHTFIDRGAWVAVGPSGRVFGEKDSGE